jgi:ribokinase
MTTVWNTAPACREKPAVEALNAVDYLICNRSELAALAGQGDIETCARALKGWGVRNVIVTLGAEGSIMVGARGIYRQPAFIVKVVDTVGAGDCFCGVFAGSLASGMSIKDSLRTASAAAAICTTRRGAQTSMPFAAEVDAFLSEQG